MGESDLLLGPHESDIGGVGAIGPPCPLWSTMPLSRCPAAETRAKAGAALDTALPGRQDIARFRQLFSVSFQGNVPQRLWVQS
jgi:hypothetical protein